MAPMAVLPKRTFCDKCSYYFATVHGTQSDGYAHGRVLTSNSTHTAVLIPGRRRSASTPLHTRPAFGYGAIVALRLAWIQAVSLPLSTIAQGFWVVVENLLFYSIPLRRCILSV